jgi:hypothetical protein
MKFDRFSLYGVSIDHPVTWKVMMDSRTERTNGTIAFQSPDKVTVFLAWGPLEEAKKKYSSPKEQAEEDLIGMEKRRRVKKVKIIETKQVKINRHEATFEHIEVTYSRSNVISFRTYQEELHSLYLHCSPSKKYFVIYVRTKPEVSPEYGGILEKMSKSLKCHTAKKK